MPSQSELHNGLLKRYEHVLFSGVYYLIWKRKEKSPLSYNWCLWDDEKTCILQMDNNTNDKYPYENRPKVRKITKEKQTHTGECNVRIEDIIKII